MKVSEDLVYLVCDALLVVGGASDACINIQTMSTSKFKALLWIDGNPFWGERYDINTIEMCALYILFWSTNGPQLKESWMDHFIP